MKKLIPLFCCFLLAHTFAQETTEEPTEEEKQAYQIKLDSIENAFDYKYDKVSLQDGLITLNVPEGYKYLGPKQSNYVLSDLWGNPPA
jgi:uncharacterized membrane-anchored protein